MTLKPGRPIRNLTAQICANPPVDRIILETPFGELLKPGQQSSDKALKLQSWGTLTKVTKAKLCTDVRLLFAQEMSLGEGSLPLGTYFILAKNRFGFAETKLLLQSETSEATEAEEVIANTSSKCDSVQRFSFIILLLLPLRWI